MAKARAMATKEAREATEDQLRFVEATGGATGEARSKCIEEYKALADLQNKFLEAYLVAFICLHLGNSDEEVRAFFSDEDQFFLLFVAILDDFYFLAKFL